MRVLYFFANFYRLFADLYSTDLTRLPGCYQFLHAVPPGAVAV